MQLGIPKTYALDAACVSDVATLVGWPVSTLEINASGRDDYCRARRVYNGAARCGISSKVCEPMERVAAG
jgi:hypothetical protein